MPTPEKEDAGQVPARRPSKAAERELEALRAVLGVPIEDSEAEEPEPEGRDPPTSPDDDRDS